MFLYSGENIKHTLRAIGFCSNE